MKKYIRNSTIMSMARNKSISGSHYRPVNWVCGYILYNLYIQNQNKFKISNNGKMPHGDSSGYVIELTQNNQGVSDPIVFQITAEDDTHVYLQGGISGTNYINQSMSPQQAIQTLLQY